MHIALSDAAWGVRRKHESQGGYFVLLMSVKALQAQLDQPCVVLDWRGYKLPRISRSSLNSEAQACAGAMDALEYLLIFWHACVTRGFELRHWTSTTFPCNPPLKAEVPQMQGDRRSKIEVMVVKQKIDEMKTKLKWISSETQLADGVTKIAARQLLADRLRSHVFSLHSDRSFQAAKRKTLAEQQASDRRNASGRLVRKGSLGFAVLPNQLEPVRGDDFSDDGLSSVCHVCSDDVSGWAVLIQNDKVLAETFTGAVLSKNVMVHDETFTGVFLEAASCAGSCINSNRWRS